MHLPHRPPPPPSSAVTWASGCFSSTEPVGPSHCRSLLPGRLPLHTHCRVPISIGALLRRAGFCEALSEHPVKMEKHCITSYPIPTRPHPGSLVSTVLPIPTLSIICLSISHLSLSTYGSHLSICPLPAYLCQSPGYLVSCLLTFYLFTCQSSFYHLSIYYLATITFLPTYLRKAESTG